MSLDIVFDHIIIGGGLSGLFQARLILQHYNNQTTSTRQPPKIAIIEASPRLGGRIYSPNDHDMGGTWIWPRNDNRVLSLCRELGITKFENNDYFFGGVDARFSEEGTIIDLSKFSGHDDGGDLHNHLPEQLRFIGGSEQMTNGIMKEFPPQSVMIYCQHQVITIDEDHSIPSNNEKSRPKSIVITKKLQAITNDGDHQRVTFIGKTVTFAMPPRLIITQNIDFRGKFYNPVKQRQEIMKGTPIWMETASKVFLTYKKKLWNDNQLPFGFMHRSMIYDVSNDNQKFQDDKSCHHTLCIFFQAGTPTPITNESLQKTYLPVLSQMLDSRLATQLSHSQIHNWIEKPFTSSYHSNQGQIIASNSSIENASMPPSFLFGNRELQKPINNIFFSSTETERENGHMEGALKAGERAASQVIKYITDSS